MERRQKSLKLLCAFFSLFVIKTAYMIEKNTIFRYIKLFHNIKFYRVSRHERKILWIKYKMRDFQIFLLKYVETKRLHRETFI